MDRRLCSRITLVAVIALIGAGCGGDDDSGDPVDAGADDSDAGVDCEDQPAECLEIGEDAETQFVGCCFENSVYWCESGEFLSTDCSEDGSTCAFNSQLEAMWCM